MSIAFGRSFVVLNASRISGRILFMVNPGTSPQTCCAPISATAMALRAAQRVIVTTC